MGFVRNLFREDKRLVLSVCLLSALAAFLFASPALIMLSFLLSLLFSFILLKEREKTRRKKAGRLASLSFLVAFFRQVQQGRGVKDAYDGAATLLVGHFDPIPMEDVSSLTLPPYDLGEYGPFLLHTMKKNAENEAYLLDYLTIMGRAEEDVTRIQGMLEKDRRLLFSAFFLLGAVLILLVMATIFLPGMAIKTERGFFAWILLVPASLLPPSVLLTSHVRLKGIAHA